MPDSNEYLAKQAYVDAQLAQKQDTLIAGQNITIGPDGKTISATGSGATYTAGTGISISQQNEIGLSAQTQLTLESLAQNKQNKLTAGDGISIEGNVISVTGGGGGGGGGTGGAAEPEILWEDQNSPFTSGTLVIPHLSEWLQVGYCCWQNSDIMSVGTPGYGEGGLGGYNTSAIWSLAHRFAYNPVNNSITINELNQGMYQATDVYTTTYSGGNGVYKVVGLIKKPSTDPGTEVLKTHHATGTTGSNGYLAIDLKNNTIDPSTVFAVVTDENCIATCIGLTWKNNALTGVFTLRGNYGGGSQNISASYTVFYYNKTIPNSGINSYVASTLTHPSDGTFAIDLDNGNINPDNIFAVVLDSTYSSSYDAICLAPSWGLVNNVSTLRSCAVAAANFNSRRNNVLIPYRVFYTTNENAGIKRVGVQCAATAGYPTSIALSDEYDKRTFFNLILNKNEPTSAPSIKDLFNKGLYFDSGNLKTYIGTLTNPSAAASVTSFSANAFYINSPEPEPSTDTCIKSYTASGTTDTHGYFPIDLQNGTVDPENVFSVVAAENENNYVCGGLTWDSNGALNGIYMTSSSSGSIVQNTSLTYTVFYYDDTVTDSCIDTYTIVNPYVYSTGGYYVDLQNDTIDPDTIIAIVVDSSSPANITHFGPDWYLGSPKALCGTFMYANNLPTRYDGQVTYKVFYYTDNSSTSCLKTVEKTITTDSNGIGTVPLETIDANKVFNVLVNSNMTGGGATPGNEGQNKGLILSNNGLSVLFSAAWDWSPSANATLPVTVFYYDGTVTPPEPSKQEVITHTTAEWAQLTSLVSEKGIIYVWSDYKTEGGVTYPGMKIGDGLAYVVDLPFMTEPITSAQITKWDNKVSVDINGENLIFLK